MSANKHGLGRYIPVEVKREVRRRCGFGCANCGATIYEYEHYFPDFSEARSHKAEQIVLLCPNCHALVTKGVLPKEKVAEISANPAARRQGFSSQSLPYFQGIPALKVGGGALVKNTPIPILADGIPLFHFAPPEEGSEVARLSINLSDSSGLNFLRVEENEWKINSSVFDFVWEGPRFKFRDANQEILVLRLEPPHFIAVEVLKTKIRGVPLIVTEDHLRYGGMTMSACVASNCGVGISI